MKHDLRHIALYISMLVVYGPAPSTCFSQAIGHDLLAIQQQNFREDVASVELVEGTPKARAIGVLDTTFGTQVAPLRTVLDRTAPRFFRFHLIDGTCVRNRVCERGLVQAGYTIQSFDQAIRNGNREIKAHLQKRTLVFKELSRTYPETKFVGSPVLEHDLSLQAFRNAADWMLEVWPDLQISNSSNAGIKQERYKGAWIECHGMSCPRDADIVSTDGIDITDIDSIGYVKKHSRAKIVFLWTRSYNCRTQGDFVMPKNRTVCPTRQIFKTLAHIVDDMPIPPKFSGTQCRSIEQFRSPQIWKPLAEDKGTGDQRANFPVLISKYKSTAPVNVLDQKGTKIGSLGYYGPFQGGLNRYYSRYPGGSGDGAYGFQEKAGGYSWLQQAGRCYGPMIAGRRQGDYR